MNLDNKAPQAILDVVRSLASDRGWENPEYDRALVEVAATLLGLDGLYADDADLAASLILGR